MTENRKAFVRSVSRILYLVEIEKDNISKIIAGLTDLIYVTILGTDAGGIRKEIGISDKCNARKYLEKETQSLIDIIEGLIAQDMRAAYHGKIKKAGDILYLFIQSLLKHTQRYNSTSSIISEVSDPVEFYKITNKHAQEKQWKHILELYQIFRQIKKYAVM